MFNAPRSSLIALGCFVLFAATLRAIPSAETPVSTPEQPKARISGEVVWPGHRLTGTVLYLYQDPTLKKIHKALPLLSDRGEFSVDVEPGAYYLVAVVDRNRSGGFDAGDAVGVHGIRSWGDTRQQKRAVTVDSGKQAAGARIDVSATRIEFEGTSRIVSIADSPVADPPPTACVVRGKLTTPVGRPSYVFAYTDLTWRQRVAQAVVDQDGSFELKTPEGKLYIAAIVDRNGSNVFDEGDGFGFVGQTDEAEERRVPLPLEIASGASRDGFEIEIAGRRTADGRLAPITAGKLEAERREMVVAKGRVEWSGETPSAITVEFHDDPSLMQPIAQTLANPSGEFDMKLPAGEYYIVVNADNDGDGYLSPGDGAGAFGSDDITSQAPQPFRVGPESGEAVVHITGTYGDTGRLARVEAPTSDDAQSEPFTGISGRIVWDGHAPKEAWIIASPTPDFRQGDLRRVALDRYGNYSLPLSSGAYYFTAIVDATGDDSVGRGDGVAIYGARTPLIGEPSRVNVWPDRATPYVHMWVSAIATDGEGGYSPLDDGTRSLIRRKYGEPNDRYRRNESGRLFEEWWYWTQGVSFTFAAQGPGWTLDDTYKFKPNPDALERMRPDDLQLSPSFVAQSTVNVPVYYESDGMIWALAPTGSRQAITVGSELALSPKGVMFRDEDRNLIIWNGDGQPKLAMPAEAEIQQLAISRDGDMLAYVRRDELRLRQAGASEETVAPIEQHRIADPSWHGDGRLLAFAAIPDEGPGRGSLSVYAYDSRRQRVEPLIEEATDDGAPVWSPSNPRALAFTRRDGPPQIWLATFTAEGERTLQQVTKWGGERPQWLPDGSGLVYETDGQIWTVDLDSGTARPLLVNGEPIIGRRPLAEPTPSGQ